MRRSAFSSARAAGRKITLGTLLSALLDQFGDQSSPASLVTRADACAIVGMEIFVEEEQIFPVRIALEDFGAAGDRPPAVFATNENMNQAAGDFGSHFPEVRFAPRARGTFDFEVLAIIMVILLQGFDEEIVQRKPDRAAPV